MKLTIKVLKKDIEKGKRTDPNFCPIARAFRRAGFRDIDIGNITYAGIFQGTDYGIKALPMKAQRFIEKFDKGYRRDTLKPFSFSIKL